MNNKQIYISENNPKRNKLKYGIYLYSYDENTYMWVFINTNYSGYISPITPRVVFKSLSSVIKPNADKYPFYIYDDFIISRT